MVHYFASPVVLRDPLIFQERIIRGRVQKPNYAHQGFFFMTTPFFNPDRDIQDTMIFGLKAENPYSNNPTDWVLNDFPTNHYLYL